MGTIVYTPDSNITEEERNKIHAEIQAAKEKPVEYDEDCPELTEEMLVQLKVAARSRDRIKNLNVQ